MKSFLILVFHSGVFKKESFLVFFLLFILCNYLCILFNYVVYIFIPTLFSVKVRQALGKHTKRGTETIEFSCHLLTQYILHIFSLTSTMWILLAVSVRWPQGGTFYAGSWHNHPFFTQTSDWRYNTLICTWYWLEWSQVDPCGVLICYSL